LSVRRPGVDGWWRKPAGRRRGRAVDIAQRDVGVLAHDIGELTMWAVRDLIHRCLLGDLFAAEPPVVVIRVVLHVIEAPIRRGFALSHVLMLTLSCSVVANAEGSLQFSASKCWRSKWFRYRQ
jgi:hypothetical protein